MEHDDEVILRPAAEADAEALGALAGEVFDRVAIDYWIEQSFGAINATDWRSRKTASVRAEVAANPENAIVAEAGGRIAGFITTRVDAVTLIGRIRNLAIAREFQGRGLGRRLMQAGRDLMVARGAEYLQIETLETNEKGQALYESFGFREVTRQIHYFMEADQWQPDSR